MPASLKLEPDNSFTLAIYLTIIPSQIALDEAMFSSIWVDIISNLHSYNNKSTHQLRRDSTWFWITWIIGQRHTGKSFYRVQDFLGSSFRKEHFWK